MSFLELLKIEFMKVKRSKIVPLIFIAPLLFHAFLGEMGGGHEFQQQTQTAVKIFRGGKGAGHHRPGDRHEPGFPGQPDF